MPQSRTDHDVVVIGAGFAGATAARELATRGYRVLVLESLERPGGRTWTTALENGDLIEVGGTYVHWLQPHTWSEITRYGFGDDLVEGGEKPEEALVPVAGGGLGWVKAEEYAAREERLLSVFFAGSDEVVPRPFTPGFASEAVGRTDQMSIADRLDQMAFDEPDRALVEAFFGTHTTVPPDEGSYLAEVRWWAPSGHHFPSMQETVWTYRLARGTRALVEAILADGGSEVRYGQHVAHVHTHGNTTMVSTADAASTTCRAVVVATPPGVWPDIDFKPALSAERIDAAREGMQAPGGAKGFAVVRGEPRSVYVQPRTGHPLGALWTSHRRSPDEQVMVFFGTRRLRDATDRDEVERAVRTLLPDVSVTEVVGRNYVHEDRALRGAWSILSPGQFSRYAPHEAFMRTEGSVAFANSDIATGWSGFIDGAIEAGIVAAAQVQQLLAGMTTDQTAQDRGTPTPHDRHQRRST